MESSKFEIPSLIPPLPSSAAASGNKDGQEKGRGKPTQKRSPGISKSKRQLLGVLTPVERGGTRMKQSTTTHGAQCWGEQSPLHVQSTSAKKRRVVLRYGETIESLFCINKDSTEEHLRLATEIAIGSSADNPVSWRRIIELATKVGASGSDLTRLHRRATLRFSADLLKAEHHGHILAIWLSFAQLHARLGATDEARRTFRHIEHQNLKLDASFYLSLAEFEKGLDPERYRDIIMRGVKERAEPVSKLEEALEKQRVASQPDPRILPPLQPRSLSNSPQGMPSELVLSPKRRKLEKGFSRPVAEFGEEANKENDSIDQSQSEGSLKHQKHRETCRSRRSDPNVGQESANRSSSSSSKIRPAVVMKPSGFSSSTKQPASAPRQKLLASRLGKKGLSGKAKRVDRGESFIQTSDSESDNTGTTDNDSFLDVPAKISSAHRKPSGASIKKLDLGYMWEWDPHARSKKDPNVTIEKTDGGSSTGSGQSSTGTCTHGSTCGLHDREKTESTRHIECNDGGSAILQKPASVKLAPVNQEASDTTQKSRSKIEQLMGGANAEFLPLVHESNILRVNGISYAKLGVIGKGGSCKVYRALSKKCSVVAIKKVKIEGMDKKAIEGYANEISLLRRLKGNPAIIQLHDSQVDLERKFILLVMELGEVDLNHVLQQRALSGASRSLNANFVRLTWQQMLSAVHCIHEERIIHSDLKPANFLFVRGALKLIDFGIAKAIQSDETTNIYRESHIGTLNYMSPEAILDTGSGHNGPRMKIGRASDVWSLGCILYEMVYGRTPFASLHFIQKLQAIVNPSHQIDFPEEADEAALDAIQQCLRRNPEDRPPIMGKGGLLTEHAFLHSSKHGRR